MAEEGSGLNPREGNLSKEGEASRSQDAGLRGDAPMLFEFVNNDGNNHSQIRRHAMRESWRQRNRGRSNSPLTRTPPRQRALLPRGPSRREAGPNPEKYVDSTEISDVEMRDDARDSDPSSESERGGYTGQLEELDDELLTRDGVYVDLRHTMAPTSSANSALWSLSTIPSSSNQRQSPYKSLGDAEIDPFGTIRLSREDKKLLYHCKPQSL